MKIHRRTYLSLGSNQGNRLEILQKSIDLLAIKSGNIKKISSVYQTKSWGFKGADFLNIVVELHTNLNPERLLQSILSIEMELGRKKNNSETYEDRPIDIDLLFFDDEIIFEPQLIVPHPELAKRNFVLYPLSEIAANFIHPILKQRIEILCENSPDSDEINKINDGLVKPVSLEDKFTYIAIEGNIGAGKTSLANMLSDDFNAKMVLERFADNPFLPKFYEDKERFAFPLEMSFLADRYQQLSDDIAQFDLFKNFIVSDYYIFKSLIFAQITLQKEEFVLYRRMFDIMYKEITKPDVYVYLYQNTKRLLENIKKRGRSYEKNIDPEYLNKIHEGYINFIKTEKDLNALIIDVSDLDFVNRPEDYLYILEELKNY
ncbi:2-amino-4-hydroxy-6-hydroxymethyldihydropteridine diphosphokinase [Flavobacteriaceae bacterium]|nr:2-amino-4-hydroxy-6-hydroxymethyldihydropteridine diphosphokinase [Flavobacteriaceae bacterium]